jgi:hypothetical protein
LPSAVAHTSQDDTSHATLVHHDGRGAIAGVRTGRPGNSSLGARPALPCGRRSI